MAKRTCKPPPSREISFNHPRAGLGDDRIAGLLAVAAVALALVGDTSCAADPAKPQSDATTDSAVSLCSTPDPTLQAGSAAELFAATRVPTFDLYLPKADWEALKVHARDEQFVPIHVERGAQASQQLFGLRACLVQSVQAT